MTTRESPGVQSVLGFLTPEALGKTQCHEHMSLDVVVNGQAFLFKDLDLIGEDLRAAAERGLQTVVDVGTAEHGRSPEFLRDLSRLSGMQITRALVSIATGTTRHI
jgi:predicted metal-dependent phosphotriesterase family hydrolase